MLEKIRSIFINYEEVERKAIFWNMLFSIMSALQSAIMIMLVTRKEGVETAGILSIAYASAYLMYTVGAYGVRDFHSTDSHKTYDFIDYRNLRIISCGVMVVCSVIYCVFKGYEGYKLFIVLLVCILKLEEVIEDLYHGEFQRVGRLDIAGRLGTFRLVICYIAFILVFLVQENLVLSILVMILFSFSVNLFSRILLKDFMVKKNETNNSRHFIQLLKACFPLFIMTFLSIYISNAPKYAIDIFLSEKDQAYYAIISMPVFTINLLSGVIYRPQLFHMAELWNTNNKKNFKRLMLKQIRNIILISGLIIIAGITIGIYLLEVLYGISLMSLKGEFTILLIGGSVVAIFNFLVACLTIVRKQIFMLISSVIVMILARVISNPIVRTTGLTGASYLYLLLMLGEMVSISVILYIYINNSDSKRN